MEVGSRRYGFTVTRRRAFEELGGTLWEMTHDQSGAQLCWLDRPDENKTFCIAFKTIPQDSTGVFHILEHSVLCGSDKYPVKEPFVELLKSSVQTYLNAMTYPDKTVYPVSSRNDKDLLNLMDVYLDAVFHPAIYRRPEIFCQEGWRYELEGEKPVYQGVVLNEMKGSFASPVTVLEKAMDAMLFPDNCYRYVSGGDPACIPDLSYEQFLASHQAYYHPSNARISLVGALDLDPVLEKLESFLSAYERRDCPFSIPEQAPVAAGTRQIPYEIGGGEPLEGKAVVSYGTLLGSYEARTRCFAADILADYLAGDNDAPLKRALLDRGLGQDVEVSVHDGLRQSWVSWEVWNTDADQLPAIRRCVRDTVTALLERGLDPQRLRACYNHFAFQTRDRDDTGLPRSLAEALDLLDTWLYGGDPAQGLLVEQSLQELASALDTDYFPGLLRELFLDQTQGATVVLVPSHSLGAEKAAREAARIAAETAAWTPARRAELEAQSQGLAQWQQSPDSPEALATIPVLQLSDLRQSPAPLPYAVEEREGRTLLRHPSESRLVRFKTIFNCADLAPEALPALSLLGVVLGTMGTQARSGEALQLLIKERIGHLDLHPTVLSGSDPEHCRVLFTVSAVCLAEQAQDAAELIREILTQTAFRDRRLLRDLLQQEAMDAQMSLSSAGHRWALTRCSAYQSALGLAREYVGGFTQARWLKEKSKAEDGALDALLLELEELARRCFTASRLTLSCTDNLGPETEQRLLSAFPEGGSIPPHEAAYVPLGIRREGIEIPAAVGFASRAGHMGRHGGRFNGSIPVLTNILNYGYLWSEIRVQGGAYGCGFLGRSDGTVGFYTYRDPQPGRSLGVMDQAPAFLRAFCAQDPDLTGSILSAVSALDPLRTEADRMAAAESLYLRGLSEADRRRWYGELLATTPRDLEALCPMLEDLAADAAACVAAGAPLLDTCPSLEARLSL